MTRTALPLLAAALLAACNTTAQTGVATTPTFAPARYVPGLASPGGTVSGPAPAAHAAPERLVEPRPTRTGWRAVHSANRAATVDPDTAAMDGATWMIEDPSAARVYRVPVALNRVTSILFPPGEQFRDAYGGDVAAFIISTSYAGPRPVVAVLPRMLRKGEDRVRGNLVVVTTGGLYVFELSVNEYTGLYTVDVGREAGAPVSAPAALPQPLGDHTPLGVTPADADQALPAWRPVDAWADSVKLVVRFSGPLPVLPALFAGQRGEQAVAYRSERHADGVYLITSRRVTEAELRLDGEAVRLTVDPAAVAHGFANPVPNTLREEAGARGDAAADRAPVRDRGTVS